MEYNFELFNAITEALRQLDSDRETLIAAQQNAEELYMQSAE